MKKSLLIVAVIALLSAHPSMAQSTFRDVPDNHWAAAAVKRLADVGIVIGRPASSVRADEIAAKQVVKKTRVATNVRNKSASR